MSTVHYGRGASSKTIKMLQSLSVCLCSVYLHILQTSTDHFTLFFTYLYLGEYAAARRSVWGTPRAFILWGVSLPFRGPCPADQLGTLLSTKASQPHPLMSCSYCPARAWALWQMFLPPPGCTAAGKFCLIWERFHPLLSLPAQQKPGLPPFAHLCQHSFLNIHWCYLFFESVITSVWFSRVLNKIATAWFILIICR